MFASKMMHPALYRCTQFFAALKAYLPAWAGGLPRQLPVEDQALVEAILVTPPQQQLFARMSPNDQRHALAVVRTLQQVGQSQPALLQAALLHDVAKSLGQPIPHRVMIVLLEAFWPAGLGWLSGGRDCQAGAIAESEERGGWRWGRRPFVVHAHHPAIGAVWAQAAGCEPMAVRLILYHQEKIGIAPIPDQEFLAILQWADNLN